jgi:putative hydrolase
MADVPHDDRNDDENMDPARHEQQPGNPFSSIPFEQLFGGFAGGDVAGLQAMFGQLQKMFTPHEGAVNWEFSRDLARSVVAQHSDPSPDAGDRARVQDAARVAEQWLDRVTDLPSASMTTAAWSRAEWVENGMPVWRRLVQPIAESLVAAMSKALPGETQGLAGPMLGMLNQIGSSIFSAQLGQAVGGLAGEVLSATDLGIPVGDPGTPAIILSNATQFASGLGEDQADVLLYLVLRECAQQRLHAHAPWLRDHLFAAIEDYGRGITIDTSNIEHTLQSVDLTQMESVQNALSGGLFDLDPTPAQRAALDRLETALALIEGWVDDVVGQAADRVMPAASALREAVQRRRAAGGPAEATFAALVGLELRPRRLRDASVLWGALRAAEGSAARDAVWAHPDLLPTAADLDDPMAFAARTKEADAIDIESPEFDAALEALLSSDAAPTDTTDGTPSDSPRHLRAPAESDFRDEPSDSAGTNVEAVGDSPDTDADAADDGESTNPKPDGDSS